MAVESGISPYCKKGANRMKKTICLLLTVILAVFGLSVTAFADTLEENCLESLHVNGEEKEEIEAIIGGYKKNQSALKNGSDYLNPFMVANYLTIDTESISPLYLVDTGIFIETGKVVLSPSVYDGVQDYQAFLKDPEGTYVGKALFSINGDSPGIGTRYMFGQNPHIATNDFEYNIDKQIELVRDYGFNEEKVTVTLVRCEYVGTCYYVTDGEKEAFLSGGSDNGFYDDEGNYSLIAPVEQIRAYVKGLYLDFKKAEEEWKAMNAGAEGEDGAAGGGGTGTSLPATGENDNLAVVFTGFCISLAGMIVLKKRRN